MRRNKRFYRHMQYKLIGRKKPMVINIYPAIYIEDTKPSFIEDSKKYGVITAVIRNLNGENVAR